MSPDISINIDPIIASYIQNLTQASENIGTCAGVVRVYEFRTGSNNRSNANYDRFKISIPYGGQYIMWEVIFNSCQKSCPPDFIFLSDNGQFIPEISNLSSLVNWKSDDRNSLLNVVKELVYEYKRYNLQKLEESPVLVEYTRLLSAAAATEASEDTSEEDENNDISDRVTCCLEEDVEAYVQNENSHIQIMIKLRIDFSRLPKFITEEKTTNDKVLVIITYPNVNDLNGTCKLCLSPALEKICNLIGGIKTNQFNKETNLKDYILEITDQIQKQINDIGQSFESRKSYLSKLSLLFPKILEFDGTNFSRINFLVSLNEFSLAVHVNIPWTFPAQKPSINLISIYKQKQIRGRNNILISKSFPDYPYSPRWPAEEMAERAKIFIEAEAINFQKDTNE